MNKNTSTVGASSARGHRREMEGVVVGRSGRKTVAVEVRRVFSHPRYGKTMVRSKRYLVHDPTDAISLGTTVRIVETRPLSARKRWTVVIHEKDQT